MNTPGTVEDNWTWRLLPGVLTAKLGKEILTITKRFGRANWDALNHLEKERKSAKVAKNEKSEAMAVDFV